MATSSEVAVTLVLGLILYIVIMNDNNSAKNVSNQTPHEGPSPNSLNENNGQKDFKEKVGNIPEAPKPATSPSMEEEDSCDKTLLCSDPNSQIKPCQGTTPEDKSAKYSKEKNNKITIKTSTGLIEGEEVKTRLGKTVQAFLGIPFAEPPLGIRRFKPPVPIKPWSQTFKASSISKHCMQLISPDMRLNGFDWWMPKEDEETTEDCLSLNIWVPESAPEKSAVLVWIHGGGFEGGSSVVDLYEGDILAAQADIIVISINYRLNAFGFLYLDPEEAPGNVGLMDQALGLKWIQDNIAAFGGDPGKVTIFGESAGGASVTHQMTIPSSQGLFKRVIAQSGTSNANWALLDKQAATKITEDVAFKSGCLKPNNSKKDIVNCLRNLDAETIIKIAHTLQSESSILRFAPVADGEYIPEDPNFALANKKFDRNIDLMLGTNTGEGLTLLIPFMKILQATEDSYLSNEGFSASIKALLRTEDETLVTLVKHFYTDWENPEDLSKIRENVLHLTTDLMLLCSTNSFGDMVSDNGNRVYRYQFDHHPSEVPFPKWTKSLHGDELFFVFGRPLNSLKSYTEEEVELSKRVISHWSNFAKYGDPNGISDEYQPKWPKYMRNTRAHLTIGLSNRIDFAENLRYQQCSLWNKLLPQFIAASIKH